MGAMKILLLSLGAGFFFSMTVFAVEYTDHLFRDPFNGVNINSDNINSGSVQGPSVKDEITGMSLDLEGLIWDSSIPQAIISGKIVKVGSQINGVEVLGINKGGVKMRYKSQEFYLRVKKGSI